MKGSSEVAAAQCGGVMAVQLAEPLEVVDSLAGTGSRAAHQAEMRTLVQPPREVPVTMTGDCQLQMHIEGGAPTRGPWDSRRAALRRELLGNSNVRPSPRGNVDSQKKFIMETQKAQCVIHFK
jgi:hypothetical protein